ncbi:MAG: NAD(P)-binding protein [Phycisphaerae bacterium]
MFTRRQVLRGGLGAAALGLTTRRAWGLHPPCPATGGLPLLSTRPVARLAHHPASVKVDGLPFYDGWTGDSFANDAVPFHAFSDPFPNGPPAPTEEADLVIVGGGISGLSTALLLRRYRPIVLDLRERFGGNARGEEWAGTGFSLGSAYFITPDPDTFLERFYRRLGLAAVARVDAGDNPVELNGQLVADFWDGAAGLPGEAAAYARYREIVSYFANERYPDIPLLKNKNNDWIRELDRRTLRQDIEERMNGLAVPALLAAAIQDYCYSSFGAGWEVISAAGGWNFIAAEEFGRWVLPGGNSYLVDALWKKLSQLEPGGNCPPRYLRAGCMVVDVRLLPGQRVQVTYADRSGAYHAIRARRVVLAGSKHIVKHYLHDLETLDSAKLTAMNQIENATYLVANVLVNQRLESDAYDTFLLRDGAYPPIDEPTITQQMKVTDIVNGEFARPQDLPRTVLTLYWPLPSPVARFYLLQPDGWRDFAGRAAADVRYSLDVLGLSPAAVEQVRMSRWGHAMPISAPGLIADGACEEARRPFEGLVYFVNQDNWALPAVETCLLEAEHFATQIAADLH